MNEAESAEQSEREAALRALVDVLLEARTLLALPANRFEWSGWEDAEAALRELDALTAAVAGGRVPATILFAPTGPLQEVSIGSGWGDEFVALAGRWDDALALAVAHLEHDGPPAAFDPPANCSCLVPPPHFRDFDRRDLGIDEGGGRFADVSMERCRRCGRIWLHYQYEIEAIPRSGRWYRGTVSPEQAERATPESALELLASLAWHLYGGSHFDTSGRRSDVPLDPSTA
ncbi:MAG TPA: hypothetical protein VFQ39_18940 [Longimicrobium sp.]|nr:hypothetical protein [Longimicrobium sp.]